MCSLTPPFQNLAAFLADAEKLHDAHILISPYSSNPLTNGGLKLPPFAFRERNESNPNEAPKAVLSKQEVLAFKNSLYTQLDVFDKCVALLA